MKLTQEKLILIVGIIAFVIAGGLVGTAWYYQEHKDEVIMTNTTNTNTVSNTNTADTSDVDTSNWFTYTNEEYGFLIKYPSDWSTEDTKIWSESLTRVVGFYKNSTTQTYPSSDKPLDAYISITKLNNPNHLTLQEYFNKEYTDCMATESLMGCPGAENVSGWDEVTFGTKKGLRSGKRGMPEGLPTDSIYFDFSDYFLVINGTYYNLKGTYDFTPDFEKILATFQFKKIQNIDTSDWLAYENDEWGFSFKYPKEWSIIRDKLWKRTNLEDASPNDDLYIGLDNEIGEDAFPRIILLVNTDGFGPLVPDARYYIKRSDGGFLVTKEEEYTTAENWEPGFYEILAIEEDGDFMIFFDTKDDDEDTWAVTVKTILSTFRFTNPALLDI
ncbi:MAG: hypothetical protein WC495_04580 [Patescibacteria group bacterium]|jgi:hypothetical protein